MKAPQLKKLTLALALQAASVSALAQVEVEEMVIMASPIRDSDMASIEAKRNAVNYMDAISSDNIGRFPDQNLADSMGRLPGIAIERDQGQARYINMRGAPFRYTGIAFDGIDVPGAEDGRIPRFDSFPSVITSRLEANKAILPSMPGEAVSGFVNVRTFRPFDQEGFSFNGDFGIGEQELGGGDVDKLALRASWSGESLGFVVFASENSREQVTDNRELDLEGSGNNLVVNSLDFRSYKVKRSDESRGGRLEYRGDGVLQSLFVSSLYTEFRDEEQRNQWVFTMLAPQTGVTAEDVGLDARRMLEYGHYENSTLSNTLGADLALGEWNVEARYSLNETEFVTNLPIPMSLSAAAVGRYDMSNLEDPLLYLDRPLSDLQYAADSPMFYTSLMEIEADKFKLDAERDLILFNHDAVLKMGLQYDTKTAGGFTSAAPVDPSFPAGFDMSAYDTGVPWDSNTTNSIGGTYYDNIGLQEAWAAGAPDLTLAPTPENMIDIEEDIIAVYGMVTTEFDWGNFVIGARYEQTDYSSRGATPNGVINVSDDFGNFLPSAHLNVDLTDNLKWRLSTSSGINRPNYNEWRAAASLNITDQEISGGNPNLEAEEAFGVDTSLEWYFADASLLSAGAFIRNIDNVIYTATETIDPGIYLPEFAGESWLYNGKVNGKDGEMKGLELSFTGHARDIMPMSSALDGFGFSANVTALDSEFTGLDGVKYGLPGTSDMIYNASLFYENYGLSLRVNYQYRDEWISPIESPDEVWGEQQRVDFSGSYSLPYDFAGAQASVYVNVNNLTDETDVRYAGNGTINQVESYGRYFLMGFRLNY